MITKNQLIRLIESKRKIFINENVVEFDNWRFPSLDQLRLEYHVEHELKGNNFWDSEDDFLEAISDAKIITLTEEDDDKVGYRSRTTNKDSLLGLLKSYRSWGTFRTLDTVDAIYNGFEEHKPMDLPIVIEFKSGRRRVFSGNTRLDIAFQLGITPKVLLVKSQF